MLNVVISFHSSMTQIDWQRRRLIDLFGPDTVYINGGSGLQSLPGGYDGAINKYARNVPRSPSDPKYVVGKEETHWRKALVNPYVMSKDHPPKDRNENVRYPAQGEPYRVCIVGFSEGCQGVEVFLKSTDIGYIDTAVAIDGIHFGKDSWRNPKDNKVYDCRVNSACMRARSAPWIRYGSLASFGNAPDNPTIKPGSRCLILTASDCAPPPCCRQARWALDYIAEKVLSGNIGAPKDAPQGILGGVPGHPYTLGPGSDKYGSYSAISYPAPQNEKYMAWGNFYEFYYKNIDVNNSGHWDHTYQSKVVLPLMLEKIVIPRWKASTGGTLVGV